MPLWDDEDFDWAEYDRDDIESIHVEFDSSGAVDLYFETDGGLEFIGTFDPDEAQEYIWDELWFWADENDIEFDKDTDYVNA